MLKYGTAGFRTHSDILLSYATKIGMSVVNLLDVNSNLDNFLGIMITASHNKVVDNGIKIVDKNGVMLDSFNEKLLAGILPCLTKSGNAGSNA